MDEFYLIGNPKVTEKSIRKSEVLLVDDEQPFLDVLLDGLSIFDKYFSLHTALDGTEAVKILKTTAIDLVVTNLSMPKMDGFELLAYMKRNYPRIPAIITTAFGTPRIKEIMLKMGAFRYMDKPLNLVELADNILDALKLDDVKKEFDEKMGIKLTAISDITPKMFFYMSNN